MRYEDRKTCKQRGCDNRVYPGLSARYCRPHFMELPPRKKTADIELTRRTRR